MKLKHLFPRAIHRPISFWRSYQRNIQRNLELERKLAIELDETAIADLIILTNRKRLLEQMPIGSVCAEVGVAHGEFSRDILDIVKPTTLHLIDLWDFNAQRYASTMQTALDAVATELDAGIVKIHRGHSCDMLSQLANSSLDWVYIDAAHDYESVKADLAAALPKIKASGWILGHDYTRWGSSGISRYGVVEAVNEFCVNNNWELRYLTNESHRHISYAIQRSSS